ncbi:hypothetical protein NQ318_019082 [Aromia moschata]|uniref:Cyclic nucleotide-binding domain-containing protein n=1 Tax=Aromia moschata TaxID=1265417 RepID=A0AAV8Y8A6_9CUCU|nr:hypothetical protein NQ318_019082 [Aromia moschata]
MIGYGDRARTQCEVVRLFRETHPDLPPLNQGTISKIEAQYREMGHVRKVPSKRQAVVDDDTKLKLLLSLEENPITPVSQLARDNTDNTANTVTLCTLGVGATFGESILQDLPRDTTVVTQTTCELLRVEQHDFRLIWEVEKNKELMNDLVSNCKLKNGSTHGIKSSIVNGTVWLLKKNIIFNKFCRPNIVAIIFGECANTHIIATFKVIV